MYQSVTPQFKKSKSIIRAYLANPVFFPDEFLARLLDDARAGRVPFLNSDGPNGCLVNHSTARSFYTVSRVPVHWEASHAYNALGVYSSGFGKPRDWDMRRNCLLVPIVLAEIRRRHRAALRLRSLRPGSGPSAGSSTRPILKIEAVEGRPK